MMDTLPPLDLPDPWIEKSFDQTKIRELPPHSPYRALRREAENPQTTGTRLEALADLVLQMRKNAPSSADAWMGHVLVMEAVVAHPNTPVGVLRDNVEPFARAFCANPVAPLVLLERPDFVYALSFAAQGALLREEAAPPPLVRLLSAASPSLDDAMGEAARLHIALAGEADSENWQSLVQSYFRDYCACARKKMRQWHIDFVELGLAPVWAKGPEPIPPVEFSHTALLQRWFGGKFAPGSSEEAVLLQRIAPKLPPMEAAHLRNDATAEELSALLANPKSQAGLVRWAILAHPSVTEGIIRTLYQSDKGRFGRVAAAVGQTPPDVVRELVESDAPDVRRLARTHPNAPPDALALSRRAALHAAPDAADLPGGQFVSLVSGLHAETHRYLGTKGESLRWAERLEAALLVPLHEPDAPLLDDFVHRTNRDLLVHLARDGNRLVRAVAQGRSASPNTPFTLGT